MKRISKLEDCQVTETWRSAKQSLQFPGTWRSAKQRKPARTTSSSCKIQDLYFGTIFILDNLYCDKQIMVHNQYY